MPRFNVPTKEKNKVINYEGDMAYKLTPELELYSAVCTASLQRKFYEGSDTGLARIIELIGKVKPSFVARLAVYAREQMHLRSIPLVLTVELAKIHSGDTLISSLANRVIQRADEIPEILSYYALANERGETKKLNKLSKQLQKGIAQAFFKFEEYHFAKYNRPTEVKFRDALFLTHPKPKTKAQKELFKKIVDNTLEIPYTWETQLSEAGKEGKDKKKVWEKLIASKKVGYMATLRNLRNMLDADVDIKTITQVAKFLSCKKSVQNSRQLPFRFLSAYRQINENDNPHTSMIMDSLEEAMIVSADNIQGYDYDTSVLIACDVSGSMETSVSERSSVKYYDIGLVLGMLLQHKCKSVVTGIFGDEWKVIQVPKSNVLQNTMELRSKKGEVGYSTNGYKVLEYLIECNRSVDKIMMFTDCQLWDSYGTLQGQGAMKVLWGRYLLGVNPEAKLYLFDLAGYGNTPLQVNNGNVFFVAGWSDKIFAMLEAIEHGSNAVKEIEKIPVFSI